MAKWFIHDGGKQIGPYTSTEMRDLVADGKVQLLTPIRREGQIDWITARSVRNLFKTSCIRRSKGIKGDTTEETAVMTAPVAVQQDEDLQTQEVQDQDPQVQDEVLAALEELDDGSDEDWDAFFQEQGQQLRGPEEAPESPAEIIKRVTPRPGNAKIIRPAGRGHEVIAAKQSDGDDGALVLQTEEGAIAPIPSPARSRQVANRSPELVEVRSLEDFEQIPTGPSTMENVFVGERRSSTNVVVTVIIICLAILALGVAVFFLIQAFNRSGGSTEPVTAQGIAR